MTTPQPRPLLSVRGIAKSYGPVKALRGVDVDFRRGEIHAVCGENGAGKSTLMKILAGSVRPDRGEIELDGRRFAPANPIEATRAGIGIVYQERSLLPNVSVEENVCLATGSMGSGIFVDQARMRRDAVELLARIGANIDPAATVGTLSIARQQSVEIAKALARRPRILILDEPTSSIGSEAAQALFEVLGQLRAEGLAIVYISHHLDEIFQIAERVTVLRDGEGRGTRPVAELDEGRLVQLMVGRVYSHERTRDHRVGDDESVLRVEGLTRRGDFADVSLQVRRGEIVALTGLVGSGRTELAEAIFGLRRPDAGRVFVAGSPAQPGRPGAAIRRGLCMLTEDRKLGLFEDMSITANVAAPSLPTLGSPRGVDDRRARRIAQQYVAELNVRTSSVSAPVSSLSGGNQQKVLFAMWLATRPAVFIVDEPTKGIDVAAKEDVHRILLRLAEQGAAVLLISSDQPEVHRLADRILVMRRGRLVAELPGGAGEEDVVAYATGART